ncbi:hypothetical protein [Streptomyces wuyuanensis]|uniref:hypothetical protein n=1 Tax=Streptomyces wuyuanensis TaxID=1196353 RepID=UPI00341A8E7E
MANKPYTVVMDWDSDWWESGADDVRATEGGDDPEVFLVWAASAGEAGDEAQALARGRVGASAALWLSVVVTLAGHAEVASV